MTWDDHEVGRGFDDSDFLQLYKLYQDRQICDLDQHFRFANYYVAILIALQTAFFIGLTSAYDKPVAVVLSLIPVLSLLLVHQGKLATLRFYRRYTEGRVRLTKIEHLLGLHGPVFLRGQTEKNSAAEELWPCDRRFLPERYIERALEHCNSNHFVLARLGKYGIGASIQRTLNIFALFSWLALLALPIGLCFVSGCGNRELTCIVVSSAGCFVVIASQAWYFVEKKKLRAEIPQRHKQSGIACTCKRR